MKRRYFVKKSVLGTTAMAVSTQILGNGLLKKDPNDTINLGVIGTGDRGSGLISVMNEVEGLQVVACCDTLDFRLAKALAKTNGTAKGYTDYRKLLDQKDIDAVLIAVPFYLHEEVALAAMEADRHIYCEKTLAKGYDGVQTLLTKAQGFNKIFQTGHQYHSSRLYTHAIDLIKDGKVGKVTAVNCQWNRNGDWRRQVPEPSLERAINWRMYREFSGGLTAELCSHQLDFVNWMTQAMPESAIGTGGIDYWKDGRETFDNVHLIYTYPNGVRAKFTCLTSNAMDDYKIKVHGDEGTLILDYNKAWFYPEKSYEKELGEVDGVSGATVNWQQGLGIPLEIAHKDSSKQALLDFRDAVWDNSTPRSSIITGAKAATCVQMGLDAMLFEKRITLEDLDLPMVLKA